MVVDEDEAGGVEVAGEVGNSGDGGGVIDLSNICDVDASICDIDVSDVCDVSNGAGAMVVVGGEEDVSDEAEEDEVVVWDGKGGVEVVVEGHKLLVRPQVWDCVRRLRPGYTLEDARSILSCMLRVAHLTYSLEVSNEYGRKVFAEDGLTTIPEEMVRAGSEELIKAGSIEAVAKARKAATAQGRISRERVLKVVAGVMGDIAAGVQPRTTHWGFKDAQFLRDVDLLIDIAENGVNIHVGSDFKPCSERGKIKRQYQFSMDAVNAAVYGNSKKEYGMIVSAEAAKLVEDMNLQDFGYAKMYGKPKGRLTSNCSGQSGRSRRRATPLNSPSAGAAAEEKYGEIHHPTIVQLIEMVLRAEARHGKGNIYIAKEDLRSYFQLVSYAWWSVRLMCFALYGPKTAKWLEGAVFIFFTGNFGWQSMPYVMEVPTRVMRRVMNRELSEGTEGAMYCEDSMYAGHKDDYKRDKEVIVNMIEGLFGPGAWADDKSECTIGDPGGGVDLIGWRVSVETGRVDLAVKNRHKATYAFLEVDVDHGASLRERQRLTSLAHRYSLVYTELKAITKMLDLTLVGMQGTNCDDAIQPLDETGRVAISIWKVMWMISHYDHEHGVAVGRPMSLFSASSYGGLVEFDGSLDGIGWRCYNATGQCIGSGYRMVNRDHYPADYVRRKGSAYQNAMEMSAVAVCLFHMVFMGIRQCTLKMRGDSSTVLNWLRTWKFRTTKAIFPIMLVLVLCERYHIRFEETYEQLTSEQNH